MNKIFLAGKVAERLSISISDAKIIMEIFVRSFNDALVQNDKRIEIRGFGIFKSVEKKSSIRRNPKTGEKVNVPAKNIIVFKPGEELKEMVNS